MFNPLVFAVHKHIHSHRCPASNCVAPAPIPGMYEKRGEKSGSTSFGVGKSVVSPRPNERVLTWHETNVYCLNIGLDKGVALAGGGGGVGTRHWWLALFACGGALWPLTLEPSAMTSRRPYYCGHPHCRGHPPAPGVGIQNATSAHGALP